MGIIKYLGFFKASDVTDKATFFLWDTYEYAWSLFFLGFVASVWSLISKNKLKMEKERNEKKAKSK